MVLRGPGGREGAGLSHAPVAPPEPGRGLPRPAQRADRRVRAGRRPDPPDRGRRFHAEADGERDRGLPAGRTRSCGPTAPGSSARGSTARTSSTSIPLATEDGMPGYAVQWIEIEGPFYDDPAGGAGYRAAVRPTAAGALGAGADGRAAGDRPEPGGRPGAAARRRAAGTRARRRRARRSTKSNPRRRGRMPSGCCDRS